VACSHCYGIPEAEILEISSGARTKSDAKGWFSLKLRRQAHGYLRLRASKEGYSVWEDYVEEGPALIILLQRE
jgi:hypothetical protein